MLEYWLLVALGTQIQLIMTYRKWKNEKNLPDTFKTFIEFPKQNFTNYLLSHLSSLFLGSIAPSLLLIIKLDVVSMTTTPKVVLGGFVGFFGSQLIDWLYSLNIVEYIKEYFKNKKGSGEG